MERSSRNLVLILRIRKSRSNWMYKASKERTDPPSFTCKATGRKAWTAGMRQICTQSLAHS